MKFLLSNTSISSETLKKLPFKLSQKQVGPFYLLTEDKESVIETKTRLSVIQGYIRDLNFPVGQTRAQEESALEHIAAQWPVKKHITGSFSITSIDKNSGELIICNDVLGVYPLYLLKNGVKLYVSNSIILTAMISGCELDEVGVAQRCLGSDFSNIGSRTILKNCKRLLPGEYLKLDTKGNRLETKYDNSLFQEMSSPEQKHQLHKEYWEEFKKEVAYCLSGSTKVNIALSGGIDSRLLLGAIPNNKEISCLTYGAAQNYETKIASRLAQAKKAHFRNFYQPDLYFPKEKILRKYTRETEAVQLCSWLEILEGRQNPEKEVLLLGEHAEGLPARNIKKFASKEFRKKSFISHFIRNKDFQFESSSEISFENWKRKTQQQYLIWYHEKRLVGLKLKISSEMLEEGTVSDLNELFSRIEAHHLPYPELYDELFSWYTYTRMRLAKQLLLSNSKFSAFCPAISSQMIRRTSNLHPNLRLNYRFVKKVFKLEDLKPLGRFPTSQAPFVPVSAPDFIRFPVWGFRSKIDSWLIKRMMKNKNPHNRYRLLKSVNWALVYQHPKMEARLNRYFKNNHLGEGFYKSIYHRAIQRKKMEQWPFANMEIINAASLNIELDIIKTYQKGG